MFGAMLFVSAPHKRYTRDDLLLAQELGRRAALAVDHARLFERAQVAVHVRDQVLAVVSHDLLNPLSTIQLLASQLALKTNNEESSAKTTKTSEGIRRATERMVLMILDLLDYSNIEAGKSRVDVAPQNVGALASEAVEVLQPIAVAKGTRIEKDLQATAVTVSCDRARTLHFFSNLVGNAIKLSGQGAVVTVRTRAERERVIFSDHRYGPWDY